MNIIFKALNDQTRREILQLLKDKDMNAGEIAEYFNISKPSISHHLDILKQAELVTSIKKGQFVCYSINTTVVEDIFQWIFTLKQTKDEAADQTRNSFLGIDTTTNHLPDD
jgi:DNA-binding transcriptional ArsR family regulator